MMKKTKKRVMSFGAPASRAAIPQPSPPCPSVSSSNAIPQPSLPCPSVSSSKTVAQIPPPVIPELVKPSDTCSPDYNVIEGVSKSPVLDESFLAIPALMDSRFEEYDKKGEIRATIVKAGPSWARKTFKGLLSPEESQVLYSDDHKREKSKAFDLLDALTKSGGMKVDDATLHVFIAATHMFENTVMDTIVCEGRNPIEALERSSIVIAATIYGKTQQEVIAPAFRNDISSFSPHLLAGSNGGPSLMG
jgi:hypothetical protein